MPTAPHLVIDTNILQSANAPITVSPRGGSRFRVRLQLFRRVQAGRVVVLISDKLLNEYSRRVPKPRNDLIKFFFELLASPDGRRVQCNWKRTWSPGEQADARKCRYPRHDDHLLRTAIGPNGPAVITEEQKLVGTDACIYRRFRVHIRELGQA